jgi:DNA anti-recombination protein RmuC
MQIEENARRLANGLAGLQKQLGSFSDAFEKLGTHLKNAQNSYQEAGRRLDRTELALEGMLTSGDAAAGEQGELPLSLNGSSAPKPAGEAQQTLRLGSDSSR